MTIAPDASMRLISGIDKKQSDLSKKRNEINRLRDRVLPWFRTGLNLARRIHSGPTGIGLNLSFAGSRITCLIRRRSQV